MVRLKHLFEIVQGFIPRGVRLKIEGWKRIKRKAESTPKWSESVVSDSQLLSEQTEISSAHANAQDSAPPLIHGEAIASQNENDEREVFELSIAFDQTALKGIDTSMYLSHVAPSSGVVKMRNLLNKFSQPLNSKSV